MSEFLIDKLEELDKVLESIGDDEFLEEYLKHEKHVGPTIKEYLSYEEILEKLPDDEFRIGNSDKPRMERIYDS